MEHGNSNNGNPLDGEGKILRRRVADRAHEEIRMGRRALSLINTDTHSQEAIQKVLHQLQVHQIELEMQNEELIRTQYELEAARSRYFDLYDLAPMGYFTLSEDGLIVEANLMAATIFGCSRSELVTKSVSNFIYKIDQDVYYLHRRQLIAYREPQSYELRIIDNKNLPIWVHVVATCEKDVVNTTVIRMVVTDISERKQVEHDLRESEERYRKEQSRLDQILKNSNVELAQATTMAEMASLTAERANLAKSDFLSNMSHELRTPLSAILGFAQLIDSGTPAPTPKQKRNLDQILRAGWYLLDLINEILDLALIESGKLSMPLEPVALSQVLRDCETMIEPQAGQHSIQINFQDINQPHVVQADRTRLKQVLINLMSNAIKYNKPNGTVLVTCTLIAERIRISVEDSGQGLSPEQVAQLFQPFNRLGQESKAEEGTGIGLVMTKRLIELMGGEIGLESEPGEGSTFWVEIPLAGSESIIAQTETTSAPFEKPAKRHNLPIFTLLYVEDNPANLMLVEDIIARRSDMKLFSAQNAISGIELARSAQPNIILMDINLPGMSGTSALKVLQNDPLTAHIPVIALSANAIPNDIKKGLDAGFFRYLTKPIKIDDFMSTIDITLKLSASNK